MRFVSCDSFKGSKVLLHLVSNGQVGISFDQAWAQLFIRYVLDRNVGLETEKGEGGEGKEKRGREEGGGEISFEEYFLPVT